MVELIEQLKLVKKAETVVNFNFALLQSKWEMILLPLWLPFLSASSFLISSICCALSFLKTSFSVSCKCSDLLVYDYEMLKITRTLISAWGLYLSIVTFPVSQSLSRQGYVCNQRLGNERYKNKPCSPETCLKLRQGHFQMKAFI